MRASRSSRSTTNCSPSAPANANTIDSSYPIRLSGSVNVPTTFVIERLWPVVNTRSIAAAAVT
jgi:hypothetical protein